MTKIEWTEKTWNPIVGCSVVSPGCTNCYAMRLAARLERMNPKLEHYKGLTRKMKGKPVWTGTLSLAPEHILLEPLLRKKPTIWFVNSMSDLFHENVPDEWIDRVFAVMALCPQHTFQVLTKRAERMRVYCSAPGVARRVHELAADMAVDLELPIVLIAPGIDPELAPPGPRIFLGKWPLVNVWKGTSAEDQRRADERIPDLLMTPAAVRFVSAEPLLGPIDFRKISWVDAGVHYHVDALRTDGKRGAAWWMAEYPDHKPMPFTEINWIIVGGESGRDARPMHPDWARAIRDQCSAAGVAFFFKQHGSWLVGEERHDKALGTHVQFQDGDQFLIVSDGHDIVLGAAQDEQAGPRHFWARYHGWQGHLIKRAGKLAAGRLLDGRTWDEMPVAHYLRAHGLEAVPA